MNDDNIPDSDLQRLWARDTEDLGVFKVFSFIHSSLSWDSVNTLHILTWQNHDMGHFYRGALWRKSVRISVESEAMGVKARLSRYISTGDKNMTCDDEGSAAKAPNTPNIAHSKGDVLK